MKDDNKLNLNRLYKHLGSDAGVSVLVGAGFSLNATKKSKTWIDLLRDMVDYLYGDEIVKVIKDIKRKHKKASTEELSDLIYDAYKEIANKYGYLEIVSSYERRMGYREAVEDYIEKRTPIIDFENKKFKLDEKEYDISDQDMEVHKALINCAWKDILTTNYDRFLEFALYTSHQIACKDSIISNDYKLSFYDTRRKIIKIHGDLTERKPENFKFDGCSKHKYIITKEDYENYPSDHEAFTQFMRISLLQGFFCLVGFSGTDPNFLNWIKWVRSVIIKSENDDNNKYKSQEPKVFLLTFDTEDEIREKHSFYENHRIAVIKMDAKTILQMIDVDENKDKRSIMLGVLKYLNRTSNDINKNLSSLWRDIFVKSHRVTPVLLKEETVDACNEDGIILKIPNKKIKQSVNRDSDGKIETRHVDMMVYHKIMTQRHDYSFLRTIYYQREALKNILSDKIPWTDETANLAIEAMWESKTLPFMYESFLSKIEKTKKTILSDLLERYMLLCLYQNLLFDKIECTDIDKSSLVYDAKVYLKCLFFAFHFNQDKLKKEIDSWNVKNHEYDFKRIMLITYLSKYDHQSIQIDDINELMNHAKSTSDKFVAVQLRNYVSKNDDIKPKEFSNLPSLRDINEGLLSNLKEKTNLKPKGKTDIFYYADGGPSNNEENMNSVRYLMFLLNYGILGLDNGFIYMNEEFLFFMIKQLYTFMPFPMMFYALNSNIKEESLVSIGQMYSYDDRMKQANENILICLLDYYILTFKPESVFFNQKYLKMIMTFLPTVQPFVWLDKLMDFWNKCFLLIYDNESMSSRLMGVVKYLICKCNKQQLEIIIKGIVEHISENKETSINLTYYLNMNSHLKEINHQDILKYIEDLFNKVTDMNSLLPLINMHSLLNTLGLKKILHDKIKELITKDDFVVGVGNYPLIHTYLHKNEYPLLIKKIMNDKSLWKSHSNNTEFIYDNDDFIRLSMMNDMPFSSREVEMLYGNFVEDYKIAEKVFQKYTLGFMIDSSVCFLVEMILFIDHYYDDISSTDKNDYRIKAEKELYYITKIENVPSALRSDDVKQINNALTIISLFVSANEIEYIEEDVSVLIQSCIWTNLMIQDRLQLLQRILSYRCYNIILSEKSDNLNYILERFMNAIINKPQIRN